MVLWYLSEIYIQRGKLNDACLNSSTLSFQKRLQFSFSLIFKVIERLQDELYYLKKSIYYRLLMFNLLFSSSFFSNNYNSILYTKESKNLND